MTNKDIRILVVDDEKVSRTIMEGKLQSEQYSLYFAINGLDAIAQLPQCNPHVILMDVMMPEMDGIEACKRIKSNPEWENIPIIFVTALDDRDTLRHGFEAGANDFVSKTATAIELRGRVRSMVKLKLQYDELAQLLKLREDMANMVAHDMRNPLTSMIGYSQLLANMSFSEEETKEIGQKIIAEGHRLNNFINDMLLMAKIEENELQLNRVETDVVSLMKTTMEHLKMSATARDVLLELHADEDLPHVKLDVSLFQRVLDNLVSNAIKYSPPKSCVRLRAYPVSGNDHTVHIAIEDEGAGIEDEQKKRIFQKFDTGALKENVLQIGLGLAFSKMVVDAHHGTLEVIDNQPRGSIFEIEV